MAAIELRLEDADFEHHLARCRPQIGRASKRWIPFGMPRLNSRFARCVFFLFARDPKTGDLKNRPAGTGVLVGFEGAHALHLYAVTAAHVAPQGASVIRINTVDGKSRTIELHPDDWMTPTSGADVAAVDITEEIQPETDNISYIQPRLFVEKPFIEQVELGIGNDGFMLGLYANHPGKDYNRIAAKFGNISLMADDNDPISIKDRPKRPAHLFDIRSRGGFSGSPVFVYRTPDGDLRDINVDGSRRRTTVSPTLVIAEAPRGGSDTTDWGIEYDTENNIFLRLLGIHSSQYPERAKARKHQGAGAELDDSEEADFISDGDHIWIESGTTVVVPAWEIRELLNRKEFVERREKREALMERQKQDAPVPEMENEEPERPAIAGDEQHKERFTALLDAAVGKPKQGG